VGEFLTPDYPRLEFFYAGSNFRLPEAGIVKAFFQALIDPILLLMSYY
jgi:hypothetical protein